MPFPSARGSFRSKTCLGQFPSPALGSTETNPEQPTNQPNKWQKPTARIQSGMPSRPMYWSLVLSWTVLGDSGAFKRCGREQDMWQISLILELHRPKEADIPKFKASWYTQGVLDQSVLPCFYKLRIKINKQWERIMGIQQLFYLSHDG